MFSEIQILCERITKFEQPNSFAQLSDFDIIKESRDKILKENNLIIFNVADSISEDSSVATNLVNEILQELSSPILAFKAK
jgi:hypothetical protein